MGLNGFMLSYFLGIWYWKVFDDDDWVYFMAGESNGRVYRVRKDGTRVQQVIEAMCCEVNFKGDWIYHCRCHYGENLYKIRTDGTGLTKINDDYTRSVRIVGDWIYYTCDGAKLHKIRTDGTERTKLCDDACFRIKVIGDWVYYTRITNYRGGYSPGCYDELCRIRTDGSERTTLCDISEIRFKGISPDGEWVYYNNGFLIRTCHKPGDKATHKMRIDGTDKMELPADETKAAASAVKYNGADKNGELIGEWVYYFDKENNNSLYRMRPDGTDKEWLADKMTCTRVEEDWIYYVNKSDDYRLYKIRPNGTERTKITDDGFDIFWVTDEWICYAAIEPDCIEYAESKGDKAWSIPERIVRNGLFTSSAPCRLYRMRKDGTERSRIVDDICESCSIYVGDDEMIYFREYDDYDTRYTIKIDGTGRTADGKRPPRL